MGYIRLSEIKKFIGRNIQIAGWLFNKRSSGGVLFLQIRDGSGTVQATVIRGEAQDKIFKLAQSLILESSLYLTGKVREEKRSPTGFEIEVSDIKPIQMVEEEYPIGKKEHGVDFLLDNRHLWLRSSKQWAIQRIRHQIILGIYEFLDREGFTKIDSPIFTPAACEGTTTLFPVDYFGKEVYLSQSGQLYLEAAIASFGKVFDFGPTFRAEKSKTRRHLTEFWMMNAEMAFFHHEDNLKFQEELIIYLVQRVLEKCLKELKLLERDIAPLEKVKAPFARLTYKGAIQQLNKLGSDIEFGADFGNDDETLLTKVSEKPLLVEKFPTAIKAFYMKRDSEDSTFVLGNDLLAPEGYGEIIGGSEREDNYQELLESIKKHNLPLKEFKWYLDLRKFGSVPHSGFGLGLERLVAWICGLKHIREAIPFPRTIYRVSP